MPTISDTPAPAPARRNWLKGLGALLTGGLLLGKNRAAAAAPAGVVSTTGYQPVYLGEIMMISWNFAPSGFAFCNGQLLPINQNQALFSLLGTTYGGDGRTTFALPDLRGRIPVGGGAFDYPLGRKAGAETHTLTSAQLPVHTHGLKASTERGTTELSGIAGTSPVHNYLADSGGGAPQYGGSPNAAMAVVGAGGTTVNTTTTVGGGQAHNNMQPFGCINFVIAIGSDAVFPSP
jgi:microcystin-dependent protein